ncbi:hypothetical protein WJX74_001028 [Apatococcus lobatus]|uniref:Uncharacterized protein n=1 Tax=Apatococcus lobatus TaxID=904363 RepID=A0AAW1S1V0_9CHLO
MVSVPALHTRVLKGNCSDEPTGAMAVAKAMSRLAILRSVLTDVSSQLQDTRQAKVQLQHENARLNAELKSLPRKCMSPADKAALKLELPEHLKSIQSELTAKEQEINKLTSLAEHAMEALLQERARADSAQTQCSQMANEMSAAEASREASIATLLELHQLCLDQQAQLAFHPVASGIASPAACQTPARSVMSWTQQCSNDENIAPHSNGARSCSNQADLGKPQPQSAPPRGSRRMNPIQHDSNSRPGLVQQGSDCHSCTASAAHPIQSLTEHCKAASSAEAEDRATQAASKRAVQPQKHTANSVAAPALHTHQYPPEAQCDAHGNEDIAKAGAPACSSSELSVKEASDQVTCIPTKLPAIQAVKTADDCDEASQQDASRAGSVQQMPAQVAEGTGATFTALRQAVCEHGIIQASRLVQPCRGPALVRGVPVKSRTRLKISRHRAVSPSQTTNGQLANASLSKHHLGCASRLLDGPQSEEVLPSGPDTAIEAAAAAADQEMGLPEPAVNAPCESTASSHQQQGIPIMGPMDHRDAAQLSGPAGSMKHHQAVNREPADDTAANIDQTAPWTGLVVPEPQQQGVLQHPGPHMATMDRAREQAQASFKQPDVTSGSNSASLQQALPSEAEQAKLEHKDISCSSAPTYHQQDSSSVSFTLSKQPQCQCQPPQQIVQELHSSAELCHHDLHAQAAQQQQLPSKHIQLDNQQQPLMNGHEAQLCQARQTCEGLQLSVAQAHLDEHVQMVKESQAELCKERQDAAEAQGQLLEQKHQLEQALQDKQRLFEEQKADFIRIQAQANNLQGQLDHELQMHDEAVQASRKQVDELKELLSTRQQAFQDLQQAMLDQRAGHQFAMQQAKQDCSSLESKLSGVQNISTGLQEQNALDLQRLKDVQCELASSKQVIHDLEQAASAQEADHLGKQQQKQQVVGQLEAQVRVSNNLTLELHKQLSSHCGDKSRLTMQNQKLEKQLAAKAASLMKLQEKLKASRQKAKDAGARAETAAEAARAANAARSKLQHMGKLHAGQALADLQNLCQLTGCQASGATAVADSRVQVQEAASQKLNKNTAQDVEGSSEMMGMEVRRAAIAQQLKAALHDSLQQVPFAAISQVRLAETLQPRLQPGVGQHMARKASNGSQSQSDRPRAIAGGHQAGNSQAEDSLKGLQAAAAHLHLPQSLGRAQCSPNTSSGQSIFDESGVASVEHTGLPQKQHKNAPAPCQSARGEFLPMQPLVQAQHVDLLLARGCAGDMESLSEHVRAIGPGVIDNTQPPACSSPGSQSQSSRANMPRSVRMWMERRANGSGQASLDVSRARMQAHEPSQSAQQLDHASELDCEEQAQLVTKSGRPAENASGHTHSNGLVHGCTLRFDGSVQHQQTGQSLQSSASSHTRLGCSTDWAIEQGDDMDSQAARQLNDSGSESHSQHDASPSTQSTGDTGSRTESSVTASEAAACAIQQKACIHGHCLAAFHAQCNKGGRRQLSRAASASDPAQANIESTPAKEAKGLHKACQNVKQRRVKSAQAEKQAFR